MTAYTVAGTFMGTITEGVPGAVLAGTIDITAGAITAMDLTVSNMPGLHFSKIYFNQPYGSEWVLSGQTPGSCSCVFGAGEEDYLVFTFGAPSLLGFSQAKITYGAVVHNTYFTNGGSRTEYYGLGLGGTICPTTGCAPWPLPPPKGVPGPVAGGGLMGVLLVAVLVRKLREMQHPKNIAG